jgi:hypothetical protein
MVESTKDEQRGFHKGSLNTLLAERTELVRMLQIVESLAQAHVLELEKLGVKLNPPDTKQKFDDKLKK